MPKKPPSKNASRRKRPARAHDKRAKESPNKVPLSSLWEVTAKLLVWCQDWEESERGWGVRPDGFTLHLTQDDCKKYVTGYNTTFNNLPSAPDEYTRASGPPRLVEVDQKTFEALLVQQRATTVNYEWQRLGIHGEGRCGPPAYQPKATAER